MADAAGVEPRSRRPVEVLPLGARPLPCGRLREREDAVPFDRQREHALGGERGEAGPGTAAVGRGDHDGAVAQRGGRPHGAEREGGVKPARVCGVHRDRVDRDAAVARVGRIVAAEGLVRVVGAPVLHGVLRGVGPDHPPALARVVAAPEGAGARVDDLCVPGIEGVGGDDVAEIEHAPGVAGVVGDVRAGHVAALDDESGIVGADGGPEHRAAAPRADDAPRVVTGRRSESGAPIELGGLSGPPRPPTGRRSESGGRGSGSGGQRESRERPHGQAAREGHCSGSPVFMRGTRSGAPGRTPLYPPSDHYGGVDRSGGRLDCSDDDCQRMDS